MRENSFDREALSAFAARAGVSQPLLHYHFSSREDLWKAAVDDAIAPLKAVFEQALPLLKGVAPVQRLEIIMRRFVLFSAENPVVAAVIANETMREGPRLSWLVEHHLANLHRVLDTALHDCVTSGAVKPLPLHHVTQSFILAAAGFFACAPLTERLYGPLPPDHAEQHADALIAMFLTGLRTGSEA